MNFELDKKEYSAGLEVAFGEVTLHYVIVEVEGVCFDVKDFMPIEAREALYEKALKLYENADGFNEDKKAQRERAFEDE